MADVCGSATNPASHSTVMPGLVPGIHVFLRGVKDVDGRDRFGHDGGLPNSEICVASTGKTVNQLLAIFLRDGTRAGLCGNPLKSRSSFACR
jgi:hypothetical protein